MISIARLKKPAAPVEIVNGSIAREEVKRWNRLANTMIYFQAGFPIVACRLFSVSLELYEDANIVGCRG